MTKEHDAIEKEAANDFAYKLIEIANGTEFSPIANTKNDELKKARRLIISSSEGIDENTDDYTKYIIRYLLEDLHGVVNDTIQRIKLLDTCDGYDEWRKMIANSYSTGIYETGIFKGIGYIKMG